MAVFCVAPQSAWAADPHNVPDGVIHANAAGHKADTNAGASDGAAEGEQVRHKGDFRNSMIGMEMPSLKSGRLEKLSTGKFKKWQKRFFVINSKYLRYWKEEADVEGKCKIGLLLPVLRVMST